MSVRSLEGIEHTIGTIDNGDNTRPAARYFIPLLIRAYQQLVQANDPIVNAATHPDLGPAIQILEHWDGVTTLGSPAMSIFMNFLEAYQRNVFEGGTFSGEQYTGAINFSDGSLGAGTFGGLHGMGTYNLLYHILNNTTGVLPCVTLCYQGDYFAGHGDQLLVESLNDAITILSGTGTQLGQNVPGFGTTDIAEWGFHATGLSRPGGTGRPGPLALALARRPQRGQAAEHAGLLALAVRRPARRDRACRGACHGRLQLPRLGAADGHPGLTRAEHCHAPDRQPGDEHDGHAEPGEECQVLGHDVHGAAGGRPGVERGRGRHPDAQRGVAGPQRREQGAEGEPRTGRGGQARAGDRHRPERADQQDQPADEGGHPGQDLQEEPSPRPGPGAVRGVGEVEVRADEGHQRTPRAKQHQQGTAGDAPGARHS
jgi:hypothetical protein